MPSLELKLLPEVIILDSPGFPQLQTTVWPIAAAVPAVPQLKSIVGNWAVKASPRNP